MKTIFLEDKWDKEAAASLGEAAKLSYRSNLLGSDLRITNFGGGNTSSKIRQADPLTGRETEVLWVKGSGGDLGSITVEGFAQLYMEKFLALRDKYRGREYEDEMVGYYPLCKIGLNNAPASIDTPLHGLIPFRHVDHMHPDWAIALAAAANGRLLLEEFNRKFGFHLFWVPWQRPGYELGVILEKAIKDNPSAEGAVMASHGIITWADEQYACYRNTIEIIDALGQFVQPRIEKKGKKLFGGAKYVSRDKGRDMAGQIFPFIRGFVCRGKKLIGDFVDLPEVLRFIQSRDGQKLAFQGTSCPDHFVRTRVRPLYADWDPQSDDLDSLKHSLEESFKKYHEDYVRYYEKNRVVDSPAMRGSNPTVVLVPGVGMMSFGKNKKEARRTGEFYVNAIHVMEGATALGDQRLDETIDESLVVENYVALSSRQAFKIEYWALEEAKLRRQPPEKEMAGNIALVVGGGSGIGREFSCKLIREGAHVAVADLDFESAQSTVTRIEKEHGPELAIPLRVDITDRDSIKNVLSRMVMNFGGIDILVNTAAVFTPPDKDDSFKDSTWDLTMKVNVSANYYLVEEFAGLIREQKSTGVVLLTSSANSVVPKQGSEPYDVSKAALNHLVRELAIRFAPDIRINAVSPATVVEGSAMFPRHRVIASLKKYGIAYSEEESTGKLTEKLAEYYAGRTLTHQPVRPSDIVEAGYFLVSPRSSRTTGHIIPVDGGLKEAFLR
jgi:rhamnulose-1-phosphate aldolase/alcohol dehydrogenase